MFCFYFLFFHFSVVYFFSMDSLSYSNKQININFCSVESFLFFVFFLVYFLIFYFINCTSTNRRYEMRIIIIRNADEKLSIYQINRGPGHQRPPQVSHGRAPVETMPLLGLVKTRRERKEEGE